MKALVRKIGTTVAWAGALLLMATGLAYVDSYYQSQRAIAIFHRAEASTAPSLRPSTPPDQSDWSANAKAHYAAAADAGVQPVALLSVSRLHLQVPVFLGTDPITLNRGAGVVDGTAYPGEPGNIAISAHRDGFFRALEHIEVGDVIDLRTLDSDRRYRVAELRIVDPLDVSVLAPTQQPTLTLITCYPFRYIGSAPDRFIVRALAVADRSTVMRSR